MSAPGMPAWFGSTTLPRRTVFFVGVCPRTAGTRISENSAINEERVKIERMTGTFPVKADAAGLDFLELLVGPKLKSVFNFREVRVIQK
jgi:hypothetical protein